MVLFVLCTFGGIRGDRGGEGRGKREQRNRFFRAEQEYANQTSALNRPLYGQ